MKASPTAAGLDVLLQDCETAGKILKGKRIGLLANAASVTAGFRPAPRALLDAGYDVRVLFGPEHGFWGAAQDMEAVSSGEPSRLPVVSLYGSTLEELSPRPEHLAGLDVVVSDLPDVGSRYYTFVWTTALMMKACAARGIPVVVLDRPNPLGGEIVEGNLPEEELLSFVGLYPIPVRHGMTSGEIARFVNAEYGLGCDLTVVPMKSDGRVASRAEIADPGAWVLPSPNMPTRETAAVYPGGCLVEGTNLSEGRGTTRPFELLGAPWLDADEAADAANALGLPGVVFRPHVFRPTFQKHAGKTCGGVQVHVTDRGVFPSLRGVSPAREGAPRPGSRPLSLADREVRVPRRRAGHRPPHGHGAHTVVSSEPGNRLTSGFRASRPTSRASPPPAPAAFSTIRRNPRWSSSSPARTSRARRRSR